MLGGPGSGPGAGAALHRTWQPAPVLPNSRHLCSTTGFTPDVLNRCGLYSVFPAGTFCPPHSEQLSIPPQGFHSITSSIQNKLSETTPIGCYTFGALTPPPGSPLQLELLAKSFSNGSVVGHPISGIPSLPTPPCRKDDAILLKQRWTACENSPHSFESLSPISSSSSSKRQYPCKAASSSPSKLVPKPSPGKSPKTSPCSRFEDGGCSRTNPIYWTPHVVKREPSSTPVTEIAEHQVKVEIGSPRLQEESVHTSMMQSTTTMASITTCSTGNGTIPVGIAVARQRLQQQETSGGGGLLAACTATHQQTAVLKEISAPAAMTLGVTGAGGPLLHCSEDRTNSIATWSLPPPHGHALATPTLWQYPAPVSMEPMLPLPVPMPPVGFQLIRDPSSGHFLLIPTTSFDKADPDQLQQAVVWPTTTYQQQAPSHHVLLPPPPPLAPLQLLGSSDYLTTASTTLHQHTQTHSTRLVALTAGDVAKRKLSLPAHTLIKIEADSQDHKTLQTVATASNNTPTVFTDPNLTPLLTTHVFYQHPANMIQISPPTTSVPTVTASLEQQTTSHITCLTPPPENLAIEDVPCVHDAGNQTDMIDDTETVSETQELVSEEQISDTKCDDGHISDTSEHTNIFINGSQDPTEISSIVQKTNNNNSSTIILNDLSYETPKTTEIDYKIHENISEKILPNEQPENIINNNNNNVDLSGLELLSNSIVEFENCRQTSTIKFENPATIKTEKVESKESDLHETGEEVLEKIAVMSLKDKTVQEDQHDSLGGLGLLCALAEQRILEETGRNEKKTVPKIIKKEFVSSDEPNIKQKRVSSNEETEHEQRKKLKVEQKAETGDIKISKLRESKLDFKRDECGLVASDGSLKKDCDKNVINNDTNDEFPINTDDWSKMNALEIDMRMRLAELQRRCEEKRLELSKLTPKTCSKKLFKKSKIDRSPSPPKLDKEDTIPAPNTHVYSSDILKPPTLSVSIEHKSIDDEVDIAFKYVKPDSFKRKHEPEASIVNPLLEKISSSKKRKVGRPKKFSSPDLQDATETIVAKKPKSLVGYLLAAKNRLQTQSKQYSSSLSPPRYTEDSQSPKPMLKVHSKCRKKKLRSIKHINKQKHKRNSSNKIRPKLKAEPLVKSFSEDENDDNWSEKSFDTVSTVEKKKSSKKRSHDDDIKEYDKITVPESVVEEVKVSPCVLTIEHLETDKLRVLTSMGGLFYAGVLSAIQPPDIYAVTLDGERGNRPHIMSQEEILRDAIVEVSPQSSDDLTPGVRLCAYWSQQYRCLYPGTVAEPETSDNLNSRFVNVEFDDGDSGCIAMEDIRLLPPDYPIIEYDPNPLLSLSKRKRRISMASTGEEQKRIIPESTNKFQETKVKSVEKEVLPQKSKKSQKSYKVHKKMKKHRKEKIEKLRKDIKKRKKKHKCSDEHCKHRKHRKHKKHKKHHHKDIEAEKDESIKEIPEEVQEEKEENCVENNIEIDENSIESEDAKSTQKIKKIRERQESVESKSKMAAFLPARQLWSWSGKGYKRPGAKGKARKQFFKTIQRGKELIMVGDAAVFLSTGRPDRPYIGRIESMWESWGNSMIVKVKWFYHPEETVGCPDSLKYPGALFESPHVDENDVQTISHKCEVLPLKEYTNKLGADLQKYEAIYDNNDIYYLAGYYDPTVMTLKMEPDIPVLK